MTYSLDSARFWEMWISFWALVVKSRASFLLTGSLQIFLVLVVEESEELMT